MRSTSCAAAGKRSEQPFPGSKPKSGRFRERLPRRKTINATIGSFVMTGHILIATDLSARSELALRRGLSLAKACAAQCTVLYVVDEEQPEEVIRDKQGSINRYLEKQITALLPEGSPRPEVVIEIGDIHDAINKTAQKHRSRLIVMGAHRRNILLDVFRGTTIERVLHTGSTPVLMAARPVEDDYDAVVFGVAADPSSKHAIDTACALGLVAAAQLTVVHAYTDLAKVQMSYAGIEPAQITRQSGEHFNMTAEKLYEFLSDTKISNRNYRLVFDEIDPAEIILKVAGDLDADLVVVGTHDLTGLRKVMLGSVAQSVLRKAHCDVLAVPPTE
ncbi:MAG: universal stress protein [Hoeflea sp.]|nr:universal stress protein [Hoeflea sp.]